MIIISADELFLNGYKLPGKLSKEEVYELLEKVKNGDKKSKEKTKEAIKELVTITPKNALEVVLQYDSLSEQFPHLHKICLQKSLLLSVIWSHQPSHLPKAPAPLPPTSPGIQQ